VLHGLNQGFDGLFLNLDSEAELLLLFGWTSSSCLLLPHGGFTSTRNRVAQSYLQTRFVLSLSGLCVGSPNIASALTEQKVLFLCWCGWCITCSIVVVLSASHQTMWQHHFPCCPVAWHHCFCEDDVFTKLLPCCRCLCWLNCSGFQHTCHCIMKRVYLFTLCRLCMKHF
jgi:hypothetical protein